MAGGTVARGKDDHRQSFTRAEFFNGGTVGPLGISGFRCNRVSGHYGISRRH